MLIVCSLGEIFRFTKEDLKQTSLKTENRRILCCLFITQKSSLLFKNDYLPCLSVTLKESQVYRSSHYEFSSVRVIITSRLCFGSWLAYNWSLERFSFPCCFSRLLTEHFYLTSVDRVGSLCTRPHRKHCHLCNYPGLFLGLWKQWWLQLAAVVKGITELLSHGLLVISRPSAHTGDRAVMLSSGAGLSGVFQVLPSHLYCKHTIFTETCWRIKRIFSFGGAWLISHLSLVCFLWCPADFKIFMCFSCSVFFFNQYAMLNIF